MNERTALKIIGAVLAAFLITVMTVGPDRVSAFFSSFDSTEHDSHEHSHAPPEPGVDSANAHAHHGDADTQITVWSDRFEIFLEHPPLVANTPTKFVTHVTDLITLEPRKAGPITFMLKPEPGEEIKHEESAPARDGIYIPSLNFPEAGEWIVSIIIPLDGKEHIIELPPSTVYATAHYAAHGPAPRVPVGFSFLKEQQWKVPTKVEPTRMQNMSGRDALVVPESALIEQNGTHALYVQTGGETFQKRQPEMGDRAEGFVQILSGLSEGEYVVTQGALALTAAELKDDEDHPHPHDDDTGHPHDGHEGHSHDNDDGHSHESDTGHTHESDIGHTHDEAQTGQDALSRYGVEIQRAGPGVLELQTKLTGEVKLNADRVAHVVPQVSGKVRHVVKSVGDTVKTGEIMAWIESATLGQAKIDYLSKFTEITCCSIELTRAREVQENATLLLEALQSSPSLESLSKTNWGPMGKIRSDLISAYAELQYSRTAYEREQRLFDQKITSSDELLKADSALKKAEALYHATRDRVAFEVQHDLLEATRAQQIRELDLAGAERHLYVLGLTVAEVNDLQTLTTLSSDGNHDGHVCTDPNCPDCAKTGAEVAPHAPEPHHDHSHDDHVCTDPHCTDCAEHAHDHHPAEFLSPNERLAWYPLRAPFNGTVISKHLSLGESVKDDAEVFIIADLSTVWVDFRVHQRDLPAIIPGQKVIVDCGQNQAEGVIAYIAPVVEDDTRTALARVVLPNPTGCLRPGTYVNGTVAIDRTKTAMVIDRAAIQYIDDQPCVFVYDGHAFDKRNVTLGRTDGEHIEISAGLQPGENVVTKNAFRIKAEMEKSKTALSGHGHIH